MADSKVENAEVAEEVCTKEKPSEQKKVEEAAEDEKEENEKEKEEAEEKTENGDAKEENGKEVEETEAEEQDKKEGAEVTVCKRKSTAGDAADGVETTPEKKQKLDKTPQPEDKEATEVAA